MPRKPQSSKLRANKNNPSKRPKDVKDMAAEAVKQGPAAVAEFNKQARAKAADTQEKTEAKTSKTRTATQGSKAPTVTRSKRIVTKKAKPQPKKLSTFELSAVVTPKRSTSKKKTTTTTPKPAAPKVAEPTELQKLRKRVKNKKAEPTHAELAVQLKAALDAHIKKYGKELAPWRGDKYGNGKQPHEQQSERNRLEADYETHMGLDPKEFDEQREKVINFAKHDLAQATAEAKKSKSVVSDTPTVTATSVARKRRAFERSPAGQRMSFAKERITDHKGRSVPRWDYLGYKGPEHMANDTIEGEATQDWMDRHHQDVVGKRSAMAIGKRYTLPARPSKGMVLKEHREGGKVVRITAEDADSILNTDVSGKGTTKSVDLGELNAVNQKADAKTSAAKPTAGEVRSRQITEAVERLRGMKRPGR